MASKQTMKNQLNEMTELLKPKPFVMEGYAFVLDSCTEDGSEQPNHLELMQEYGFTDEVAEKLSYDKRHSVEGFEFVGTQYMYYMEDMKNGL